MPDPGCLPIQILSLTRYSSAQFWTALFLSQLVDDRNVLLERKHFRSIKPYKFIFRIISPRDLLSSSSIRRSFRHRWVGQFPPLRAAIPLLSVLL
jgi:hypothetical protein